MGIIELKRDQLRPFLLDSQFQPSGDQPAAIQSLVENFKAGVQHQTLLGVTGSGKTFTMAHTIQQLGLPTLIMAPNKTLAGQLYAEMKQLFPKNAVEYFVSYYDYYQPEAYIPSSDTFIEKDSAINEQIDRMRHSATRSLFERNDVIIVSSVSCIYGLGSPEAYERLMVPLSVNQELKRDDLLRTLVNILYNRNDVDFSRGTFRVRGDVVEVFPSYEDDKALRIEFFGDYIEKISWIDPLRGKILENLQQVLIFPGSHYVNTEEQKRLAIESIRVELRERMEQLKSQGLLIEAQRIEQRTSLDLEMIEQMGFCHGIENYSRHFNGRGPGDAPPTLIEYFPKDFLCILDESHVTVPQIGGMYRGDRARKMTLVEHGFRLPSALDNRPLNFQEFESLVHKVTYVSATPGAYEYQKCQGLVVEQIIRPTGLIDPLVHVKPATHQVDDLVGELRKRIAKNQRVLVTTLTKRMSEDLADYLGGLGLKVKYLHSEILTMQRSEIIRDLRLGVFDVLIGINLLREGLDIPEVSLVAIMDADKEGFLRSERSLIQTIGRAARNSEGEVILYADRITESMKKAISETARRRTLQTAYNAEHGITPQTIHKKIPQGLLEMFERELTAGDDLMSSDTAEEGMNLTDQSDDEQIGLLKSKGKKKESVEVLYGAKTKEINKQIENLRADMKKAAKALQFEEAASLRDQIKRLQLSQLELVEVAKVSHPSEMAKPSTKFIPRK